MKWICSQIGPREHYAVARALHAHHALAGLVTDWYAPRGGLLRQFGGLAWARAAQAARAEGIPDAFVYSFPFRSLLWKWTIRRLAARGGLHEAYSQTDRAYARAAARRQLPRHEVFFGYSYASLETLAAEQQRGVATILDQIDPGAWEFELVAEEMARFPELAGPPPALPAGYYERNRQEWALADRVVVNSVFSRDALVKQGVPGEKLVVIPLCFETAGSQSKAEIRRRRPDRPLRVLFLGQVILRKGIHYLMEAARLLEKEPVQFDVVGPIGIFQTAVAAAPKNMTFHGRATRDQTAGWYRQSDLFILPTLSDGFAITQLEAMSYGLPVIATSSCGEVVTDGVDGHIVPARATAELAGAIQRHLAEPDLLPVQSAAALRKAGAFTLERLAGNLQSLGAGLFPGSPAHGRTRPPEPDPSLNPAGSHFD